MGVALAVPLDHYTVLEAEVRCVAEAQRWGRAPKEDNSRPGDWTCPACQAHCFASRTTCFKCKEPKPSDAMDKLKGALMSLKNMLVIFVAAVTLSSLWLWFVKWLGAKLGLYTPKKPRGGYQRPPKTIWQQSQDKNNRMVYFRLAPKSGNGQEFGVATYHMPCVFWEPKVMVVHAALAAQRTAALARGAPHVLLGDFNFKPGDAAYRLVTEGTLDESDPHYPAAPAWEPWRAELEAPMTSAYAAMGGEPAFTNHTVSGMNPAPFTDTLDYIFYSEGFDATAVMPTPPSSALIEECKAPQPGGNAPPTGAPPLPVGEMSSALREAGVPFCPNFLEPSDHIMIAAELTLLGAGGGRAKAKPKRASSAAKKRPSAAAARRARSPSSSPPPKRATRSSKRIV